MLYSMRSHMLHQFDISCLLIAGMKNSRARAAHEGRVNSTGKRIEEKENTQLLQFFQPWILLAPAHIESFCHYCIYHGPWAWDVLLCQGCCPTVLREFNWSPFVDNFPPFSSFGSCWICEFQRHGWCTCSIWHRFPHGSAGQPRRPFLAVSASSSHGGGWSSSCGRGSKANEKAISESLGGRGSHEWW